MKAYKLQFVMYDPSESTEPDKYMAEIPALPGCRVWGDSPEETMDILQDVAAGIIETHVERGYELKNARTRSSTAVPDWGNLCITPTTVIPNVAKRSEESKVLALQDASCNRNGPTTRG